MKAGNRIAWPRPAGSKLNHCDISIPEFNWENGYHSPCKLLHTRDTVPLWHQGLSLQLSLGDVLNSDLLKMGDDSSLAPIAHTWLAHANGVGQHYLRSKMFDDLLDFHIANPDVGVYQYNRCDAS